LTVRGCLVVALLWSGVAAADESGDAKQSFEKGAEAYDRGDYGAARDGFERAWQLSHNPQLLFDLARVEGKLGHDDRAVEYLQRYLQELPDSPDAPTVRAELEARQRAMSERKALTEAEAREATEKQAAQARADEARKNARMQRRTAGWALFAVGLGLVGGGVACGALAAGDSSKVQSGGMSAPGRAPEPYSRVAAAADAGPSLFRAGVSLDVIGGALAAVGAGLVGWSYRF
jgi:tetratricopeptide (TPR) repeat protein